MTAIAELAGAVMERRLTFGLDELDAVVIRCRNPKCSVECIYRLDREKLKLHNMCRHCDTVIHQGAGGPLEYKLLRLLHEIRQLPVEERTIDFRLVSEQGSRRLADEA